LRPVLSISILLAIPLAFGAAPPTVVESARQIPVAYEVDVAVAGGSTGAVAAAVAAAEKGARVFLAAPRPYLGEDMCATMALWLEAGETPSSSLARGLFAGENPRGPFRPMQIKKTLDEALLAANVRFLYSTYVTDVLTDKQGKPGGLLIANRAGRQAVLAKVIIDATERGAVARMAGARFEAFPAGPQTFRRVVIGGEPKPRADVTARKTGLVFQVEPDPKAAAKNAPAKAEIVEYTLRIPMTDGSYASYAQAEQTARDLTHTGAELANTEQSFQVPPQRMKGARSGPLAAFRPAGVARVYVLGGAADVSREEAAKLLRPVAYIEAGLQVGAAAAKDAESAAALSGVTLRAGRKPPRASGDVKETLAGVRGMGGQGATVPSTARALPVLGTYDVVVVGGGTGGAPAGIAAARQKARTLVLEYLGGLGGVGTLGLISSYYWGFRGGFTKEVPGEKNWDPLQRAEWWRRTLRDAGAEIWFGVLGCGAFVEGNRVAGVVVATPEGRGVVLAKTVIDATGNSDIAAAAGARTVHTDSSELAQQGTGLPRVRLGAQYTNTDFTIADETDMLDIWHLMVYAKNKYAGEFDIGQLVDSRERRRIVGDFTMTILDQMNARTYPDTISIAYSNFDTHGYTVDPYLLLEHPERKGFTVRIPYRCLLPQGLDGILVTGLGISVHRDAVPLTRMQPDVQNQGYAAGLAAATIARTGGGTRRLDVRALQKQLAAIGIVPESVLAEQDSYPISDDKVAEAVAARQVAVILARPEVSSPLLRQAYRKAASEADKLAYARILAVLGDATGLDTLIAALNEKAWDKGWNYTGQGQFGLSLSPVDSLIVGMGRTLDRRALDAILRKAALLDASSEFSHHRAVALALESLADPAAAGPLAALLSKPGIMGNAITTVDSARERSGANPNDNATRSISIRELELARALFRCGDHDGLGRKILMQYSQDLRGHVARHARAVLEDVRFPAPKER
jgi:flavin-dependent dehydrogenase